MNVPFGKIRQVMPQPLPRKKIAGAMLDEVRVGG